MSVEMSDWPGWNAEALDVTMARDADGTCVIALRGELDLSTAPALDAAMQSLPLDAAKVRLDLSELSFVDSAGLRQLVISHGSCAGTLTFANLQPHLEQLFKLTGLEGLFTIERRPD